VSPAKPPDLWTVTIMAAMLLRGAELPRA
jgi:hypothetical protein